MHHASPTPAVTMMSYPDGPQMTGATPQHSSPQPAQLPPSSSPDSVSLDLQLEVDKQAIYRHPLFSLLGQLFEKCERATQGSDCITSASFDVDIQTFVRQQELEHKPFFSEDPELDSLIVKAIQVLRIHLLELEKVCELCKDFCQRYRTCIKTKMHSDNLLKGDLPELYSPSQGSFILQQDLLRSSISSSPPTSPSGLGSMQQTDVTMTTISPSDMAGGGASFQPITMLTTQGQLELNLSSLLESKVRKSKAKRGVLPKRATNIMRSWLFQHLVHPYPTEDEKRHIATQTRLTLQQVNNWFINARRRVLQPMLDASNPDPAPKAKKMKSQHRSTQRFWPHPLATGTSTRATGQAPNTSEGLGTGEGARALRSESAILAMRRALLEEDEEDEEEEEGGERNQHYDSVRSSKPGNRCNGE